jgi:hypothetical protein
MLQQLRMTMYAQPVLKSSRAPEQIMVGSAALMVLDPTDNEDFSFVTPDSQPFKDAWDAFYRWCSLTRNVMGFSSLTSEKPENKSGVSKAWDFFEAEKIMARMALNEQEAVKQVLDLAARWMGGQFTGEVQYATTFDLATSDDDMAALITMQAAQVPSEAQKELMRRAIRKLLPSMSPETQKVIMGQIDTWRSAGVPGVGNPMADETGMPAGKRMPPPAQQMTAAQAAPGQGLGQAPEQTARGGKAA